jgi:hypothetical protein
MSTTKKLLKSAPRLRKMDLMSMDQIAATSL